MGYQESWLYVQPQMCFSNLIRAYEKTARTDYYRTMGAEPMSVVILKRPFGEVPKGVKLLWAHGCSGRFPLACSHPGQELVPPE